MDFPKHLKALVFDAYGTLFHIGALDELLEKHFSTQSQAIGQLWRSKQLEYTWLRSLMGSYQPFSQVTADALEYACNVSQVSLSREVREELVEGYYHLRAFPEVKSLLSQLGQSFRLAVLSNANPDMLGQAVKSNELDPFLEKVLSVDAVGRFKPDPAVYQLAVDALELDKASIGFISTNTWDVAGATSFGLSAIHLNRFGSHQDILGQETAPQILSLADLLE